MAWITELLAEPIAGGVLGLFAVIAAGLGLGKLRVAGVSVGVAGVLFAGLVAAAAGLRVDGQILKFTGEIGLILFVYAVGLSVGPALLGALRSDGLVLNGLAAGIVIVGATLTYGLIKVGLFAMPIGVGVFCGATTNTPALGAATKLLDDLPADSLPGDEYVDSGLLAADGSVSDLPAVGYAVAYPFGVVGIIVTTLALKVVTKTDPAVDASELQILAERSRPVVARGSIRVTNPNLDGRMLKRIPGWRHRSVVVSRILRGADLLRVDPGVEIRLGDVISVVGDPDEVDEFRLITGETADVDPYEAAGPMVSRRLVVTNRKRAGQAVGKLRLAERVGVTVTRVRRAGVDFAAKPDFKLALGDAVRVVGEAAAVDAAARDLGHSPKDLDIPDLIPLSAGIAVGVLLGSIPFAVPGVPVPLKLGLAAGPLLVAIVGGMLHRVGPFVFYLSPGASHVLRDLGIGLFLAAVGLRSGDGFVDQAFSARGLTWMAAGAVITLVPLSIAAAVGTYFLKARYLTLAGVLAGSMTDPPALAFANAQADSDAPSVAYATVYPLTMILRLVCAQALILLTLE